MSRFSIRAGLKERVKPEGLTFLGRKHTSAAIQKMKQAQRGKKHWNWRGGLPKCDICDKPVSRYTAKRHLKCQTGQNNPNWKGGVSTDWHNYKHHFQSRRFKERGGSIGKHTSEEWETLKATYNHTCLSCRRREPDITLTRDHIQPISRGGTNSIDNIQPLCMGCNARKATRLINYVALSEYA